VLNYHQGGFGYSIDVNSIHINTLNINDKYIKVLPDSRKVRLYLSNIDIDSTLDGKMNMIGFITLNAAALKLKNLTIQVDLEAVA
jgi:hypothetical protein